MTGVGLRHGVRLVHDGLRDQLALLAPEGVLLLNETAAAVVLCCDSERDVPAIAAELARRYDGVSTAEVATLVADLTARQALSTSGGRAATVEVLHASGVPRTPVPFGLLAELTYRCPLRCPYCSNPVTLDRVELTTAAWCDVLDQARALGVLQVHLSGGEPLARRDVVELVRHARRLGLYTNLVTSGIGLSADRLAALVDAGLDHVQLSIQDSDRAGADAIAGIRAHDRKLTVAAQVTEAGLPLSVNVVLHRHNLERFGAIARLAVSLGAQRIELAHTQYYGWGLLNRDALLPTRAQVETADRQAAEVVAESGDQVEIVYVRPDYHDGVPKPCMNGWARRQLVVTPDGQVLPCPAAGIIPDLDPPRVPDVPLADAWYDSAAFNRFRGTGWMAPPCQGCPRREEDYGGCRCQAFQLTGDAAATDPVCALSPHHGVVTDLVAAAGARLPLRARTSDLRRATSDERPQTSDRR